jgi:protein TonB
MSQAAQQTLSTPSRGASLMALFLVCSLALHALALGLMSIRWSRQEDAPQPPRSVELVMVEVEPAKPPAADLRKLEPTKPKAKPPPIRTAEARKNPPKPKDDAPPPPNQEAPEQASPPLVVGLSMSSTTTASGVAAPVGNTLYGQTPQKAVAASEAKPYSAPRYTPIYQVDSEPTVISDFRVYPNDARRAGIEGTVLLSITIDIEGTVVNARVMKGPGRGLNEAALEAIRKFKFKPAMKAGQPVSTEITYKYTFQLN